MGNIEQKLFYQKETMKRNENQDKKNNWIRNLSVYQILGGMMVATALAALVAIWVSYAVGNTEYESLRHYVTVLPDGDGSDTETMMENNTNETGAEPEGYAPLVVDFDELKDINPDIVAWIAFDNIDISYPVVQRDNSYYLSHTFEGKENAAGCIFMEETNAADFSHSHTILYGHNMKNGSMFGMLKNYKEQNFFEENRYFTIYTPEAEYRYEIFSVRTVSVEHGLFTKTDMDEEAFEAFLADLSSHSNHASDTDLTGKDRVVTLSTCTYSDDLRFVVTGVCISCKYK